MLSYQHAYHAGNAADVHKHLILTMLLESLTRKPRPITYMETHAGRGLYDLASPEATKTGEADRGITALLAAGAIAAGPYAEVIGKVRQAHGATAYPGSPMIGAMLLRPGDQLHLMELHPREHAALKAVLKAPNIHVHKRDGFEGVLALSPPTPRRGLVLVDPSYEVKTDYAAASGFAAKLLAKWPQAVVMLWYPVLLAGLHEAMVRKLTSIAGSLHHEVTVPPHWEKGMSGSGVIMLNAPHGLREALRDYDWPFEAARLAAG